MKHIGRFRAAMLALALIGTAGFAYAQHDDKGKGPGNQDRQAQPSGGQLHGQPQQSARPMPEQQPRTQQGRPQGNAQQHAQPRQPAPTERMPGQKRMQQQQRMQLNQQRDNWQQHRANNFESQRRTWVQRGGYQGQRVPDANFSRRFGRQHSFRVFGLPFMEVGGQTRFQYGGYWFSLMDPYPEYWGSSWYRNDDMYVDYNDGGYYLYNRRYPRRPGVAISISF